MSARKNTSDTDNTREKLIEAAKKCFALKGYEATTVKELADEAGVNVSLVSYHFEGKNGLAQAVMEGFAKDRFQVAKRILQLPQNVDEFKVRLEMLIGEILGSHIDQPQTMCILNRELENLTPVAIEIFKETFLKSHDLTVEFFKHAQKIGIIRKEMSPLNITSLFMGSILFMIQKDSLNEKIYGNSIRNESYRKEMIKTMMSIFMNGLIQA